MRLRAVVLLGVGLLFFGAGARADTALVHVTPENTKKWGFTVTGRKRKSAVNFVIRRNIAGVEGPGRKGYLSRVDDRSLGTPVKLEEKGKTLTFRFSVPASQVPETEFTLWGLGLGGEGVTFDFRLADFWKPKRD